MREREAHQLVAGTGQRMHHGGVRGGTGVRLDVRVLGAEQLLRAIDRDLLGDVDLFAAAVVAATRVPLGVLVGEHRPLGLEHGPGDEVLAGDHLERALLAGRAHGRAPRRCPGRARRWTGRGRSQGLLQVTGRIGDGRRRPILGRWGSARCRGQSSMPRRTGSGTRCMPKVSWTRRCTSRARADEVLAAGTAAVGQRQRVLGRHRRPLTHRMPALDACLADQPGRTRLDPSLTCVVPRGRRGQAVAASSRLEDRVGEEGACTPGVVVEPGPAPSPWPQRIFEHRLAHLAHRSPISHPHAERIGQLGVTDRRRERCRSCAGTSPTAPHSVRSPRAPSPE